MKEFWKENRCFFLVFLLVLVLNLVFPKYFIRTGSMEPALKTGAIVWINPYEEPEPQTRPRPEPSRSQTGMRTMRRICSRARR